MEKLVSQMLNPKLRVGNPLSWYCAESALRECGRWKSSIIAQENIVLLYFHLTTSEISKKNIELQGFCGTYPIWWIFLINIRDAMTRKTVKSQICLNSLTLLT